MNCIFLLLLLSCCGGWGNGGRSGCGCMTSMPCNDCDGCREERRNSCDGKNSGRRNPERRESERRESERRPNDCGCEESPPVRENCDCGCAQNDREGNAPGMIPPPWQEYPQFPRRDNGDCCEE